MTIANSIIIVSNRQEDILNYCSKIDILRDVDTFIGSNIDGAFESCRKNTPDAVIFFIYEKDPQILEILREIRQDPILKNTSIIFIYDSWDEEFALTSFDAGVNDFIVQPVNNSELLMRTLWSLQKSVLTREMDKKSTLLSDLGVYDKITRAYKPEFIKKVFTNEINNAKKYNFPIALMAVCLDAVTENYDNKYLAGIISDSIRATDCFGVNEEGNFIIVMRKTGILGAQKVYERVKSRLNAKITISAGISEFHSEMNYDSLTMSALKALKEAIDNGGSKIAVAGKRVKPR